MSMKLSKQLNIRRGFNSLPEDSKLPIIFCLIVIIGLLIGCLVCMVNTILGKPIFPYGTFVFLINRCVDLFDTFRASSLGDQIFDQLTWAASYIPFTYAFLKPLIMINCVVSFWLSAVAFFIFTFIYIKRNFKKQWLGVMAAIVILLSYPFLYAYDRANIEIFIFIFLALFMICYRRNLLILAAFMLSVAVSMKLYPIVLILLFVKNKQFKPLLYTVIFTLVLTYIGYIYTGSNLSGMVQNFRYFDLYSQKFPLGLIFSHSLFNLFRLPFLFFTNVPDLTQYIQIVAFLQPIYAVLVLVLFVFISLYVVFISKEFWKSVLILFLVLVSFPYVSQDYTLMHLTIPLLLLFNAGYNAKNKWYVILIAFLFIPMNWITWAYPNAYPVITGIWCYPITPGLAIRPIIILILLCMLIKKDFTFNDLKIGIKDYLKVVISKKE